MKYVLTDAAVRKLRGVLAPRSGNTGAGGAAASVSPDDFPPPFTVRWSQSEGSGQGAWVIWLPMNTGGNHVYIGRERRSIGNLSAAQTLPAGWYILGMLSANYSGSLWLNASKAKEAGHTESTFLATTGQGDGSGNMYWYAAIVARIDYDSQTGARRVKQLIDSTVTFGANIGDGGGGGGGGLSGTVEFVADNDWYVNGSVHQLRKRLRVLDLATGQVTDKAGTTYANGWEVITDTTPISAIIGS